MRTALAALLAVAALVTAAPRSQSAPDPEQTKRISALLRTVRSTTAAGSARESARNELLELGWRGPRGLASALRAELQSLRRKLPQQRAKLVKAFTKRARAVLHLRLDKKARAEIDTARATVLRNARDAGLSKQRIVEQSDPALQRLRELLLVTVEQVWEANDGLHDTYRALRALADREQGLYDYWVAARRALEQHPDAPAGSKRLEPPHEPQPMLDPLDRELDELAQAATPISDSERKTLADNAAVRDQIKPQEYAGILHLNQIRLLLGLRALAIDVKLCTASRGHSKDMHEIGFFSHTSPVKGKASFGQRAALAGTSARAENIAVGASTGVGSIVQWWYSPGHHRNMLGGHARIGLGRHERHWTQMFG